MLHSEHQQDGGRRVAGFLDEERELRKGEMFSIKETSYGLEISLSDVVQAEEMARWEAATATALRNQKRPFGVLLDVRTLKPLNEEAAEHLVAAMKQFLRTGLERAAVVFTSALLKMQFKRLSKGTGLTELARYVDANAPDWESRAQAWIVQGKDPEK